MADKKISQLPQINALSGSSIIVPLVHDSTTQKMELGAFASYVSQWSAKTGSANTFSGTQTFSGNVNVAGNVNVNGRLTVHEIVANYETSSILFSTGSTKLGDQITDKHEFTGSTNITGSLFYNDVLIANIDSNTVFKLQQATASIHFATQSLNTQTGSQESINTTLSIVTGSMRAEIGGIESYTASLKGQAIVSSSTQISNYYKFAETASANTFYGVQTISGSINVKGGVFNVLSGSANLTSSIGFKPVDYDLVQGASVFEVRHTNNIYPEELALKLSVSDTSGTLFFEKNGSVYNVLSVGGSSNILFISRNTRLLGTGLTIDDSLLVKGVITGSILATNGVISSSNQLFELNAQTGSQDLVNRGISSVTGSINTTTSSFDSVFLRISSTTGSINTTTSSFDSVFLGISSVTGSLIGITNALMGFTASLDNTYATDAQLYQLYQATASIHFTTQSLNTQTGSQDLVNRGISSVTGSINTTTSSFDLVFRGISSVTGAINLTTSSLIGITNGLMAFTAALDNTYATDAQLYQLYQATASIHSATASLNTQTGSQDLVNRGISSVTGSINTTTSSFNSVFLGISSVTGAINTQSSSQDLVNLGISSVTGSLIGITNGLMAFTAALDNTYATDAQLYQLYQATASIHFATQSLNTQTGSQDSVNLGISTVTGSFRAEIGGIEAYTSSLKAAAIVSSSTQIQNYNVFARTGSANSFYGAQSVSGSLFVTSDSGFGTSDATGSGILKVISAGTQNAFSIGQSNSKRFTGFGANDLKVYGDDYFITTVDAFPLSIGTNNTSRITIANDGGINATGAITASNFRISTAGGGIDFSVTSNGSGTTSSELLNDYEEGTWTATATYSGTNTPTHAYQTGHYTKIGRVVHIQALVSWNENGSTGNLTITGLPFTSNSTVARPPASLINIGFNGITTNLVGEVENNTTYIKIRKPDNSGTLVTDTDTDNDQDLYINCTYMV